LIPVLSRKGVRAFDARTIEAGVPGIVLMENAGRGAATELLQRLAGKKLVVVACGTGNNGGDGFVLARHLRVGGLEPRVVLVGQPDKVAGDARLAYDAYLAIGGTIELVPTDLDVVELKEAFVQADAIVDALFGTGLDRPLSGTPADVAEAIASAAALRVALDVPSGINADTGAPLGPAVIADVTLTFGFLKTGLMTPRGRAHAGALVVVPIGVPPELARAETPAAELVETSDLAKWLVRRGPDVHKYSAGHVAVVGGSPGKLGAALMASESALRAGAGAATIVTWPDAASKLEARVHEVMVGRIENESTKSVDAVLQGKKAVVLGPGLGLDAKARTVGEHVLATYLGPLVLDADGLSLFAGRAEAIAEGVQRARVLTPHAGEAARLLSTTAAAVELDRIASARSLAAAAQSIVVLKGAHSVIADPDGRILLGPLGSAALATAGSGDVLSGILGAMLCVLPPLEAAATAVTLHAEAGRAWEERYADRGLLASAIAEAIPGLIGELRRVGTSPTTD
jgi:NAD(P)H-hydrate epimerase